MVKGKMSKRQQQMITFIRDFLGDNNYPPTIREIGRACQISSTSVVNYNLNKLEDYGLIHRNLRVSRGIQISDTQHSPNLVPIPLVGRIFASKPVPVPDAPSSFAPDEYISLARDLVGDSADLFALEVSGDSMIDAMIGDGDVVVMKRQIEARNGDLAAIWLNDREETTLKHFFLEKGRVRLHPANPTMHPIYEKPENVQVQGKVVLVVRQINKA